MPATRQNVEALVLGASYAIEISRPSLAWQLNVKACEMCVLLGYHRQRTRKPDAQTRGEENCLFWFAYMFDKALALRLGLPSILQDYDITIPRRLEPFTELDQHREIIESWISHAEVQGQIYEKLYSPSIKLRPLRLRVQTARTCIDALLQRVAQLNVQREHIQQQEDGTRRHVREVLVLSEEVGVLSTLTLVHRALPSAYEDESCGVSMRSGEECLRYARESLEKHFLCIDKIQGNPMLAVVYMHWCVSDEVYHGTPLIIEQDRHVLAFHRIHRSLLSMPGIR